MDNSKSTALAVLPQQSLVAAQPHKPTFREMIEMGNQLVSTGFLPQHIKTGVQAAAIMMKGEELGMPPMRALGCLYFIKGKVSEASDSQLARFKNGGGHAKFVTLTNEKAELWLKHPNGDEHTETFTIEDARRAGLFSNSKYTETPKAMLRSRAITAGLKSVGWDGASGAYDFDAEAEVVTTPVHREGMLAPAEKPAQDKPPPVQHVASRVTTSPAAAADATVIDQAPDHTAAGEVVPAGEPAYADMNDEQKIEYWRKGMEKAPDRPTVTAIASSLKAVEPQGSAVFVAFQKIYNAAWARTKPADGGGS